MKTILVTGGVGFIGSNLCAELVKDKNNYVYCFDNLISGDLKNIEELKVYKNFKFVFGDITDSMFNIFERKIDEIYNTACCASPVFYQKYPFKTIRTCTEGVFNLLDLAKNNSAKFLQFSTSEVYGDPNVCEQVETYWGNVNPNGIRSCYDEGKRCAESICMNYKREYNVDVKIIRIFNTYGPKMRPDDGRVVSNFITQAINNKDITVYGTGTQTRSFCYIDDLINGIICMMGSTETGPINFGNPVEYLISDIADIIKRKVNSNSNIVYKDLPEDDPKKRKPNIELAKEKLKWSPKISLEEGLTNTIQYFLKNK